MDDELSAAIEAVSLLLERMVADNNRDLVNEYTNSSKEGVERSIDQQREFLLSLEG